MNSSARAGSTAFQASLSTSSDEPTTQPSAALMTSPTVSCRTLVFARTGTAGRTASTASGSWNVARNRLADDHTNAARLAEEFQGIDEFGFDGRLS